MARKKGRKKSKRRSSRRGDVFSDIGGDVAGLTGVGIGLGVGAVAVGKAEVGLPAGAKSSLPAFGTAAGFMPTITTAVMGGRVLGVVRKLQPKKRRSKKGKRR